MNIKNTMKTVYQYKCPECDGPMGVGGYAPAKKSTECYCMDCNKEFTVGDCKEVTHLEGANEFLVLVDQRFQSVYLDSDGKTVRFKDEDVEDEIYQSPTVDQKITIEQGWLVYKFSILEKGKNKEMQCRLGQVITRGFQDNDILQ